MKACFIQSDKIHRFPLQKYDWGVEQVVESLEMAANKQIRCQRAPVLSNKQSRVWCVWLWVHRHTTRRNQGALIDPPLLCGSARTTVFLIAILTFSTNVAMRIIRQNVDYDVARRGIERERHARRNYFQQPQTTATRNLFVPSSRNRRQITNFLSSKILLCDYFPLKSH